jgi:hypothetical protein
MIRILSGTLFFNSPRICDCGVDFTQFHGIILRPTSGGMEVVTTSLLVYAMFKVVWDTWISKLHGFFLL